MRQAIEALEPPVELRRLRMRYAAGRHFADVVIGVSGSGRRRPGPRGRRRGRGRGRARRCPGADVVVHVEPMRRRGRRCASAPTRPRSRVAGVREIHNVAVLDAGDRTEVSLHLKLPGDLPLAEAHEVASAVEAAIQAELPEVDGGADASRAARRGDVAARGRRCGVGVEREAGRADRPRGDRRARRARFASSARTPGSSSSSRSASTRSAARRKPTHARARSRRASTASCPRSPRPSSTPSPSTTRRGDGTKKAEPKDRWAQDNRLAANPAAYASTIVLVPRSSGCSCCSGSSRPGGRARRSPRRRAPRARRWPVRAEATRRASRAARRWRPAPRRCRRRRPARRCTKTCGIVGQLESAESSWRMAGSGRTSTAITDAPAERSASSARAELPQSTRSGVPFMKSTTSSVSIVSLILSLQLVMLLLGSVIRSSWIVPSASGSASAS